MKNKYQRISFLFIITLIISLSILINSNSQLVNSSLNTISNIFYSQKTIEGKINNIDTMNYETLKSSDKFIYENNSVLNFTKINISKDLTYIYNVSFNISNQSLNNNDILTYKFKFNSKKVNNNYIVFFSFYKDFNLSYFDKSYSNNLKDTSDKYITFFIKNVNNDKYFLTTNLNNNYKKITLDLFCEITINKKNKYMIINVFNSDKSINYYIIKRFNNYDLNYKRLFIGIYHKFSNSNLNKEIKINNNAFIKLSNFSLTY